RLTKHFSSKEKRLVDIIVVKTGDEHKHRLEIIDNEDDEPVVNKVRESLEEIHGQLPTDEYIRSGVIGLKQYYAIALLDPLNAHSVSEKIDLFWHSHILHSRRYIKFCNKVVGEYMHHLPLDRNDDRQIEN